MRLITITAIWLLSVSGLVPAAAQQADMPPIDRDLWTAMQQAFGNISMPLQAHQQMQQIMQSVEQQAAQRKAQKDAGVKAQEKPPDAK